MRNGIILYGAFFLCVGPLGRQTGQGGTFCGSIPSSACVIADTVYPLRMFFLTRREQMVMIFILTSLVLGAGIRHYRLEKMLPSQSHPLH